MDHEQRLAAAGIIPAHAGNTGMADIGDALSSGSSPRMRGTRQRIHGKNDSTGIIPAHAGNTRSILLAGLMVRDHPRACGEHALPLTRVTITPGSSPRMRGTPSNRYRWRGDAGIIPAHAGNTYSKSII